MGDPVFGAARPLDLRPDGPLDAFAVLDDLADAAQVAHLVEMDHFVREKYAFRLLCIRYLASRGWRWFGEEIDHRAGARTDEYLRSGDETLLDPIEEPDWYTAGPLATGPPRPHPADALARWQRQQAVWVREHAPGARWFGFDVGGDDHEYLRLANAATSFEELGPAMAYREERMHARVDAVLDRALAAGEKVALLAGSIHLAKDDLGIEAPGAVGPGGGAVRSIGHHTTARVDGAVLALWLLYGPGRTASPWLPAPGSLHPVPGTVNEGLTADHDRPVLLPVRRRDDPVQVTQMHDLVLTCRLHEQADAVVFAPTVTPL